MATDYFNTGKAQTGRKLNKIIDELKEDLEKLYLKSEPLAEIIESLERIRKGEEEPKVKPLALYLDIIETILSNSSLPNTYPALIHNAEEIYEKLFLFGENTPEFEKTAEVYKLLAGENGLAMKGFFDPILFASFTDKTDYLTLISVIQPQLSAVKLFNGIRTHALEVRQYFIDDGSYMSYLLNLVCKMSSVHPDVYEDFLKDELWRMQRVNGLYDIDPVRLAQVEKNVHDAALTIENGRSILEALEQKSRELDLISGELDKRFKETVHSAEQLLDTKTKNAEGRLDEILNEYTESRKNEINLEKEIFLKQFLSEAEAELAKYKAMAKSVTGTAAAEISSLGREADSIILRLKEAEDNNAKLRDYSEKARKDSELLEKIARLQILNDGMIERINSIPKQDPEDAAASDAKTAPAAVFTAAPALAGASRPIPAVSPLLDRKVPFKERFAIAMKEKQRREKAGELFHEMFNDVLTAVMEEVNPYLIGPSGCGKTYMVRQIGELLNVDLSDIGYINEEYDILGYVTAMGEYSASNFYRLYKYGGIAFCDELDNGNSKATVKLNSFLSNHINASYCFPGGERVEKHPNFRVIAAGNTDGSGADLNYNTRERIEESVQQRMIPIYIGYDNRVEEAILKDHHDWFVFACAFRKATDQWTRSCGIPAQGIFTTRDAFRIKEYLDNGSFTAEKIMNYEFIQTKEAEYLAFLKDAIGKLLKKDSPAIKIYQLFAAEADRIRQTGRNS